VISSVEITRFRGIREGKLEDLTPLVVLVGPNGCGKSSVLDAILIGAAPVVRDAIGQAAVRHQGVKWAAQWLLWRTGEGGPAEIVVTTSTKMSRGCRLEPDLLQPNTTIRWNVHSGDSRGSGQVTVNPPRYSGGGGAMLLDDVREVRIVESPRERTQSRLHELLTQCIQRGQRAELRPAIAEVVPDVTDIVILTEQDSPIVHLEYPDHSIPAALAGDGIHSLLCTALELTSTTNGAVLFEEPEVHQHPGAIRQAMRAILAAVRRDIQVILTTHSLELIDCLLAESSDEDLERLSLYRLQLDDGGLVSHRMSGPEVSFARTQIENDLR